MVDADPSADHAHANQVGVGAQSVYNAVAVAYDRQFGDELDGKPLVRTLLNALVELVGTGVIADVGCGPGHITRYLAHHHGDVVGIDLSPGMIAVARARASELLLTVGSMLSLPVADRALAGAVALYSIIHLTADERATAFSEFARAIAPRGWLLVAFHVDSPEFAVGDINHLTEWFGHRVELDGDFLSPNGVADALNEAGFTIMAKIERQPISAAEYPSRRCYILAKRDDSP
jgi:ubiquinone/menaquinone biosynthesis C-methylase UbiE